MVFSQRYAIHRPHGAAGATQPGDELFHRHDGGEDARGVNIHAPRKRTGRGAVLRATAMAGLRRCGFLPG